MALTDDNLQGPGSLTNDAMDYLSDPREARSDLSFRQSLRNINNRSSGNFPTPSLSS